MQIPFTYLIGWSSHNIWYYGVRYAKNATPNSLWTTYFTSSKLVKELKNRIGDPDVIQIRKTFNSREKAVLWESKVLRRLKLCERDDFLNKARSTPIKFALAGSKHWVGRKHSEETKAKMRKWVDIARHEKRLDNGWSGRKHSEETKAKMREEQALNPRVASEETRAKIGVASRGRQAFLGRKHSEETKAKLRTKIVSEETRSKLSLARKTRAPISEETREKMRIARKGQTHSEETKAKMRAARASHVF